MRVDHAASRGGSERARRHALRRLGGAGIVDGVVLHVVGQPWVSVLESGSETRAFESLLEQRVCSKEYSSANRVN